MSPDKSLQNLFNAALERSDAAERARFLGEACGTDAVLREGVEKLLRAQEEVGAFMAQPSRKPAGLDLNPTGRLNIPLTEKPGDLIGRYKLLQQIGEGGCGVVYMAEQEEPVRRRVALKVVKLGMDTKQVIARFEAERQALALMDHPNIAKVLDAGATDTGRPYFVMELVRGIKITAFCDENKLSTEDRLRLFIQVCQAIQHAHQKGVIHRDIKPSNILVTINDGVAVPKVIDFGIAKATAGRLTDQTLFTAFEQFIGTPAYMSPEQAVMTSLDIDTRSDIYSLGVLLYELLTGRTPFEQKELLAAGLDEMRRTIRDVEPPRPSTCLSTMVAEALATTAQHRHIQPPELVHLVRGDLDWIVMKCLEKDRARRYETANGLAMDLKRHLNCEPVIARPPSRLYEFQKTVNRHKFGFAAAGLVLAALLAGMAGTTWGMFRAEQARQDAVSAKFAEAERREGERRAKEEAQKRLEQIEKATEILSSVFRDLDPMTAEQEGLILRDLLSRRLIEAARQLEGEAVGGPLVVARLQHALGISLFELGHWDQAREVLVKASRTRERMLGSDHLDTAATKQHLAILYRERKEYALAESLYKEVLAVRSAKLGDEHVDTAATKHHLAMLHYSQGKHDPAEALLKEVLAVRAAKLGADNPDTLTTQHRLAEVYLAQAKYALSETLHREVLATRTSKLGADHLDTVATKGSLALLYKRQGNVALAEAQFKEVLAVQAAKLGAEHHETLTSQYSLAELYRALGKNAMAEPLYKEVLAVRTAKLGAGHPDTILSRDSLAMLYSSLKKPSQSIPLLEESLKMTKVKLGPDHPETLARQVTLGANYCDAGRFGEGLTLIEEVRKKGRPDPHPAWVRTVLLKAYVQARKTTEATTLVTERLRDARAQFPADSPELAAALIDNGKVLLDAKAYAAAEPLLLNGFKGLRRSESQTPPQRDALEWLVQLYDAWDKPDEAAKWRRDLEAARAADRPQK